jgi:lipopolysaccharide biosynthesis regulator YciM
MKNLFFFILIAISPLSIAQDANEKIIQNDYLLAENYFRGNAFEKATLLYKKLYDSSPFNTNYLERLISWYQETDRFLIAEQLLKNKIKTNKDPVYLYVY